MSWRGDWIKEVTNLSGVISQGMHLFFSTDRISEKRNLKSQHNMVRKYCNGLLPDYCFTGHW